MIVLRRSDERSMTVEMSRKATHGSVRMSNHPDRRLYRLANRVASFSWRQEQQVLEGEEIRIAVLHVVRCAVPRRVRFPAGTARTDAGIESSIERERIVAATPFSFAVLLDLAHGLVSPRGDAGVAPADQRSDRAADRRAEDVRPSPGAASGTAPSGPQPVGRQERHYGDTLISTLNQ